MNAKELAAKAVEAGFDPEKISIISDEVIEVPRDIQLLENLENSVPNLREVSGTSSFHYWHLKG